MPLKREVSSPGGGEDEMMDVLEQCNLDQANSISHAAESAKCLQNSFDKVAMDEGANADAGASSSSGGFFEILRPVGGQVVCAQHGSGLQCKSCKMFQTDGDRSGLDQKQLWAKAPAYMLCFDCETFRKEDPFGSTMTSANFGRGVQFDERLRKDRDHFLPIIAKLRQEKERKPGKSDWEAFPLPPSRVEKSTGVKVAYKLQEALEDYEQWKVDHPGKVPADFGMHIENIEQEDGTSKEMVVRNAGMMRVSERSKSLTHIETVDTDDGSQRCAAGSISDLYQTHANKMLAEEHSQRGDGDGAGTGGTGTGGLRNLQIFPQAQHK